MKKEDAIAALVKGGKDWQTLLASKQELDFSGADLRAFNLRSRNFPRTPNFDGCEFNSIELSESTFEKGATFRGAKFHKGTGIGPQVASQGAFDFSGAEFFGDVTVDHQLSGAVFVFSKAKFNGKMRIRTGPATGVFNFQDAKFHGEFRTQGGHKFGWLAFAGAQFGVGDSAPSVFRGTTFSLGADFKGACFHGPADFDNTAFERSASFVGCTFHTAPSFHGAQLHKGTLFSDQSRFPRLFLDLTSDGASNAYRTLKHAMNEQHAWAEEMGFFLLEMRASERRKGLWNRALYKLYDCLSIYGLSAWRPFLWLLTVNIGAGLLYSWLAGRGWGSWHPKLLALTLQNAVPFAAALRWEEVAGANDPTLFPKGALNIVPWIVVSQSILSAVLLFLVGLGLRNMFRIR